MIFYFVIVFLWLGSVLFKAYRTEGDQIIFKEGDYYDCSEGWYDDEGNVYNIEDIVFTRDDVLKEKVIHYRIPEDCKLDGGEAICFFARGLDFTVYTTAPEDSPYYGSAELGSRTVYEYKQNSAKLSGDDIGLTVQVVPINIMDRYNEISISMVPTEYSAFILEMRIEKASDYIYSTIRSRMPRFIWSVFIIFFGFATIVYSLFAVEKKREEKTLLYAWGAYSIIIGTLLTIESMVIQILTGRPELLSSIKYALALLISFPSAVLIDSCYRHPHKHFSHIIGAIIAGLFVIESVATFFFDVSLYRLFLLSAIIMLFNMILSFTLKIKERRHYDSRQKTRMSTLIHAVSLINMIVIVVDLGSYAAASRHMTDWGRIMRVFYVIFLFIMLIIFLRLSIVRNEQAMLAEKYKLESRTDALTGLLNKGAYIEKESELTAKLMNGREKKEKEFSFAIMSLDLNYLKKVNDTLGHEEGDYFIKNAASILKAAVGDRGETYRTGGDEFLAIIYGEDPEASYQTVVEDLKKLVEEFNDKKKKEIPLSFAYGHAICTSSQNYSIHDSERIADKEMYECKRIMKAER
ncbi:MAG: GGDEF domain-containing protein [Lachnospiraceae bacterium]|nr:GGDEF domain-containing protein [Lachnospiraceae bacterium]